MSDVEKFYEGARKYFPHSKPWAKLNPFEQAQLIQGINLILGIMYNE
jgi:hypothetical protein